uniref:Thyroglobulin type-1 domain-containing protein n=1 Tax=Chromera velia CCMP2878 TaxID=1169474 RepID=A0A0G4HDT8_9ALVE|eukprot:Cvel_6415.t1-p1 / transcript=Cvel_6415.t1 / gene=Cvel_6415 / organism=Chromera_velia_CCMP2878 / gene_product=hypothetical protein / transcript_product=hypothetical protein / location=Cvel_scaffold313:82737-84143(+) / protein_length=320 / sequence_SO=supercontig / SO=protein_coding / is_pseudo=false
MRLILLCLLASTALGGDLFNFDFSFRRSDDQEKEKKYAKDYDLIEEVRENPKGMFERPDSPPVDAKDVKPRDKEDVQKIFDWAKYYTSEVVTLSPPLTQVRNLPLNAGAAGVAKVQGTKEGTEEYPFKLDDISLYLRNLPFESSGAALYVANDGLRMTGRNETAEDLLKWRYENEDKGAAGKFLRTVPRGWYWAVQDESCTFKCYKCAGTCNATQMTSLDATEFSEAVNEANERTPDSWIPLCNGGSTQADSVETELGGVTLGSQGGDGRSVFPGWDYKTQTCAYLGETAGVESDCDATWKEGQRLCWCDPDEVPEGVDV